MARTDDDSWDITESVGATALADDEGVGASAAGQKVVAGPAHDRIIAGRAVERDLEIAGRHIGHRDAFQHDAVAVAEIEHRIRADLGHVLSKVCE